MVLTIMSSINNLANQETSAGRSDSPNQERKSKNLVEAAGHLKEEALRRYKISQEQERKKEDIKAEMDNSKEAGESGGNKTVENEQENMPSKTEFNKSSAETTEDDKTNINPINGQTDGTPVDHPTKLDSVDSLTKVKDVEDVKTDDKTELPEQIPVEPATRVEEGVDVPLTGIPPGDQDSSKPEMENVLPAAEVSESNVEKEPQNSETADSETKLDESSQPTQDSDGTQENMQEPKATQDLDKTAEEQSETTEKLPTSEEQDKSEQEQLSSDQLQQEGANIEPPPDTVQQENSIDTPADKPESDAENEEKEKNEPTDASQEKEMPENLETGTDEQKDDTKPASEAKNAESEEASDQQPAQVEQSTDKVEQSTDKVEQSTDKVVTDEQGDKENEKTDSGEEGDEEKEVVEGETGDENSTEAKEVVEVLIPNDFYYTLEDHVCGAEITEDSGLPQDLLTLKHSFGYDCKKRCNLHMLDQYTLLFMAGNLVQLMNIQTKELTYIRSTSGGGIGAIAVHPSRKYFAVGEKGSAPNINIFEFPSLKLFRILRGGTEEMYASLTYSPDGELLASQGGEPDFMLTVWNWKQEKIMLRTKAFSQEVFRVSFSSELEGQLTTAGTGHIKFWKMADTFTGLKLQGELGRFGKTEISDIEGYVELPDGKVLSGAETGNMLLWEGGLIKVEIGRKGKKLCHNGQIQQILLDEGELMTIGVDGFVRMWDFETIDTADTTDDSGLFEMEPMNELRVGYDVQLKHIVKSIDDENEATIWFAQDGNGGIWKLDLSFSHTSLQPEKISSYHAGAITSCVTSPVTHLVATTGVDHTVRVYDYMQEKLVTDSKFTGGGTTIMWAPKIVDTKGSTMYVGFEDGVLRILNINKTVDVPGRKHKSDCEVTLKQALKPHKSCVTSIAVDGKGEFLATGGKDSTVFFIGIGETYEPIGFVNVPAPVRHLQWSPEKFSKTTLLVICEDGYVVELETPDTEKIDTSHSYHITSLNNKQYKFTSIKSNLRHEEELERKRIEEEIRLKKEEEEKRKRRERGLEDEEEEEEEVKKPETPKEEWKPYIPEDPSPILQGFYSIEEGKFWLSMGDFDAGYLYECKFASDNDKSSLPEDVYNQPVKSVAVVDSLDVPITVIRFSNNGQQAIFGMENGKIRVQQLDEVFDISTMASHWMLSVHDNHYGHVTGLALSFDSLKLLSVGADGNFFMFNYMEQQKLDEKIAENKAKIPSARKEDDREEPIDDIDDPNAYSIEDAKQKAEYDKLMKQAEEKKRDVRRNIAKLRRQFKSILEQNEDLPKDLQLNRMEFEMDREIKLELERQTEEKIETVRKEMAWESEKHRVALDKLRKRFKNAVECEKIILKCFLTPHEVSSFRAAKLSDDFYKMKANFERRRTMFITRDEFTRDPTRDLLAGQSRMTESSVTMGEKSADDKGAKVTTTLKGSMGERVTKALQKVEEKKKKRAARRSQWSELYETKPADDYEDPADVAKIKHAQQNMGDYKLKTAKDYVVPDHLRMNVEKARGRLLVLKDLIHEYRYDFNVKLLALRDKKIRTIEEITDLTVQLEDIHNRLDSSKQKHIPPIPQMHDVEQPEKKLEYTRETLLKFKKEKERDDLHKKTGGGESSGFGGGFGGMGGDKHHTPSPPLVGQKSSLMSGISKTESSSHQMVQDKEIIMTEEVEPSPLELQLKQVEEIRLVYEQDRLLKRIDELLKTFDAELRLLRHDKFKMDILMKNADLRQVTLFEEFVLLKEYEKREELLADKVSNKQQEKLDMQTKIMEVQAKLENKKKDIEKLVDKEKKIHTDFLNSLGENNKFVDYLTKVFKKKIKRSKKKLADGAVSDEDSDEDSDDESDWEESDEESESEAGGYDLDVCPPGCELAIYDKTCQIREKRLENEDELTEEKKNSEAMKKELEGLQKKAKVIDSSLNYAQGDLEAFQLEKQQKLNELDVVVTLRLHQIQYFINSALPQDLSKCLVFESSGVEKLQHRIKELEQEKHLQKKQMREAQKKHSQLKKYRKEFEKKISEMNEKCNEMMIAKFGCIVDLEKLETVVVNRGIEEMKEKLRVAEIQCSEEVNELSLLVSEKKNRITELIKDNTHRLEQLCMFSTEKKDLENSLDSRQKNLGEEYSGQRKADIHEKSRLIQLVQLQAQEIEALKDEIMLLSRKGGHILPPAQPPLPQTPTNQLPNL
ncbi:hypothetical protein SNE40_023570 [Patella caerulea]|uniref:Cilia- and flagella-associated protein 44 n=1 Tax=Patella caerulea TaxID=87958 RepID=A0AAN8GFM4_PATCE